MRLKDIYFYSQSLCFADLFGALGRFVILGSWPYDGVCQK